VKYAESLDFNCITAIEVTGLRNRAQRLYPLAPSQTVERAKYLSLILRKVHLLLVGLRLGLEILNLFIARF